MADTNEIATRLLTDLQNDLGLTAPQAARVVGNLMHESGGFGSLQEISPLVPGSQGGYGYAQWTGPRRDDFEAWTDQQGLDPTSYDANYGFLRHELENNPYEAGQFNTVRNATTAEEATRAIANNYLRPGIPHMPSRLNYAQQALTLANGTARPDLNAIGMATPTAIGTARGGNGFVTRRPQALLPPIGPSGGPRLGPVMRPAAGPQAPPRQGILGAIGAGLGNIANMAGQQAAPVMRAAGNLGQGVMRAGQPLATVAGRTAIIDTLLAQAMNGNNRRPSPTDGRAVMVPGAGVQIAGQRLNGSPSGMTVSGDNWSNQVRFGSGTGGGGRGPAVAPPAGPHIRRGAPGYR